MTRDRPPSLAHLTPQLVRSPWPITLPVKGIGWGDLHLDAPVADHDILTQLCVARR